MHPTYEELFSQNQILQGNKRPKWRSPSTLLKYAPLLMNKEVKGLRFRDV